MPTLIDAPAGLEGVIAAETSIGHVRGREGFYHYRQYSAVDLASSRSFEDVWYLMLFGSLPDRSASAEFSRRASQHRFLPPGLKDLLRPLSQNGSDLDVLRTSVSVLGAELGWAPTLDIDSETLRDQTIELGSVVPTILAAAHRLRSGLEPVEPRGDL